MQRLTANTARQPGWRISGQTKGHWLAVPSSWGTQTKAACARIGVLKSAAGVDVTEMFPAKAANPRWTTGPRTRSESGRGVPQGRYDVRLGLGQTADSVGLVGVLFAAYGAALVDAKGDITVKSDEMGQVLEYAQKLVKLMPADAVSYDDASNNRALISGKSALIFNPPSAWAVAKRDKPSLAADSWTFPAPIGPKGRFVPISPSFWGVWKFARTRRRRRS